MKYSKDGRIRKSINSLGMVSYKSFFYYCAIFLFSIMVTILIAMDDTRPSYYKFLPLLPLCHVIIIGICLFINGNIFEEWDTLIAISVYSIRNLITPFIMFFGEYYGSFLQLNNSNVFNAIVLMLYETFFVLIFLTIYGNNKKARLYNSNSIRKGEILYKQSKVFTVIIDCLVFFCLAVYILMPTIRKAYTSLFYSTGLRVTLLKNSDVSGASGQRSVFTLFQVVFPIAYTFLCVRLLYYINKKIIINKGLRLILNVLCIMIPGLFMDGGDGNTIIFISALLLTALFIDGRLRGGLVKIAIIGGGSIVLYVFIQAMTSTFIFKRVTIGQNLSNMFQAYFPGVCNMAGLFNMKSYNKFQQLFFDFYSTIPFRNTLFGLSGIETTPNLYTIDNNALSHIMPCIAHSYYYLGFLGPVIPCLFFKKAIDIYNKMQTTRDPYKYVTYCLLFLYLVLTPIMYNSVIFLRHFFATFLPMLILCSLNRNSNSPEVYD